MVARLWLVMAVVAACVGVRPAWGQGSSAVDFTIAKPGYQFTFPRDHGQHREFETEWWYYTGQLYAPGEQPFRDTPRYGFQLTFFRRAVGEVQEYLAHTALTDIRNGTTTFGTRRGGGLLGAAGVSDSHLQAWSGDWRADLIAGRHVLSFTVPDSGSPGGALLRLVSAVTGEPWLQGEKGFSKKGGCPGCASLYYSIPQLLVEGELSLGSKREPLHGVSWMDHEVMTSALAPDQVGWDWMGLMMKDGSSLMVFAVRGEAGSSPFVSGTLLVDGRSRVLDSSELQLEPVEYWVSPRSQARYPTTWRVRAPKFQIDLTVRARVADCEVGESSVNGNAPVYWEGPVASDGEAVIGYLEMTGYAARVKM